jgi:NAD(P)-dependent dehydrogenase (short-subunit alcohol dehydrogenase family)
MNNCDLTGKFVMVTGASSGIGKETAIRISKSGARVIITGRNSERLTETFELLEGDENEMLVTDLTEEPDIDALVSHSQSLDGLVHCAGVVGPTPAKFIRQENINKIFRINYEVPVLLTAKILMRKKLKDNASVVFISSVATRSPYFGGALYGSSKAALEAYSSSLALELVGRGIRSNIISPGLVRTRILTDPAREGNPEIVDESIQKYLKKYPMGIGEPKDVANVILFLLSDESKWVSGSNILLGGVIQ